MTLIVVLHYSRSTSPRPMCIAEPARRMPFDQYHLSMTRRKLTAPGATHVRALAFAETGHDFRPLFCMCSACNVTFTRTIDIQPRLLRVEILLWRLWYKNSSVFLQRDVYVRPCQRSYRRFRLGLSFLSIASRASPVSVAHELQGQRQHARTNSQQQHLALPPPGLFAADSSRCTRNGEVIMPATPASYLRCPGRCNNIQR
jgi:hypothetical protein